MATATSVSGLLPDRSNFSSDGSTGAYLASDFIYFMNLFERLYRYREKAGKHERENYLTELLAAMLERYPALSSRLCEHAGMVVSAGTLFLIRTQVSYDQGQPDVVVESITGDVFLLIECKLEAGQGHEQLKRYQRIIDSNKSVQRGIVFLTKYYALPDISNVACLRWYQLFSFLNDLEPGELLTFFRDYLTYHRLNSPMNFLPADLIALEQIQATIFKMDEVLGPVEGEFRKHLGGTYQYTKSRSPRLPDGWYGYERWIRSTVFKVGFRSLPGNLPACFIEMESWDCASEPVQQGKEANVFQQALRKAWNLPDAKLNHLVISRPVTSFMLSEDDGVGAMRAWFSKYFEQLNTVAQQHGYFWNGAPEVAAAPNETLAALAEQELSDDHKV